MRVGPADLQVRAEAPGGGLQPQEETPRKHGDDTCQRQSYTWYRPAFLESLLGCGVSSGEFVVFVCVDLSCFLLEDLFGL